MANTVKLHYLVDGNDFTRAGEASAEVKKTLRKLGVSSEIIRKVAIALYEGEINMVIHADGGQIEVLVSPEKITMHLKDTGKGIEDVSLAMQEGYTTAPDEVRSLGFGAGMGLPNMKRYSDEIEVNSTVNVGTDVYMTVYIEDTSKTD